MVLLYYPYYLELRVVFDSDSGFAYYRLSSIPVLSKNGKKN
jgi:hypothetical protein